MRTLDLDQDDQFAGLVNLNQVMARLKARRLELGWSQQRMADEAGISLSTVSKYERGLFPTRVVWLAALIHALGYKIDLIAKDE